MTTCSPAHCRWRERGWSHVRGSRRRWSASARRRATWFAAAFAEPTPAQDGAWEAIAQGHHALVVAPTGSGKTLSAFLWAIDRLLTEPGLDRRHQTAHTGTRVLYISPLKALAVDVERNLRAPLVGIRQTADRLGERVPEVTVGIRSGDTPAAERRTLARTPPDILITTPESLFLMLTSQARESLRDVETVIVDEVHAVAGTKRGAHLGLSLERLDALLSGSPPSGSGCRRPSGRWRRSHASSAARRRSRSWPRRRPSSGTSASSSRSRT